MAKGKGRLARAKIFEEFAKRRGGGNYFYAMHSARSGLVTLGSDYADAPSSYKPYLAAGICTTIECHLKYAYAHAAERFVANQEVLVRLFHDIEVDIETLISTTSRVFTLADIAAANISISSMDAYQMRASELLTRLSGKEFKVPWSFESASFEPGAKKQISDKWKRLTDVFDLRHRLIHEIVSDAEVEAVLGPHAEEVVRDADWVLEAFEEAYWRLKLDPKLGVHEIDVPIPDGVTQMEDELDRQLQVLKDVCEPRELKAFRKFERSLKAYLWSRSAFEASVYAGMQSEETAGAFIDLAREYKKTLREVASKIEFVHDSYPYQQQLKDMGIEFEDAPKRLSKKRSAKKAKRSRD